MAPEQIEGREVDGRTDIFAFGVVLFEMLSGRRPFAGDSRASLMAAIVAAEPPALSSLQPRTPASLERLIRRCLAKDPEDRWQTARDMAAELRWIAETGSSEGGMRGNDPLRFSSRLRDLTSALDPTLRLRVVTLSEMKRQRLIALRLMLLGFSLVIVTVLLLSASGIYAMMSFTVSRRRKEIGIRAALGAGAGQLLRSIFTKAALQLAAGVVVGIVLALMTDRASGGELLGSFGRALLLVTAVVMTIVGLFATIGPARRGLRIQPTEALRAE
jgi:hypothetical protein